ncbi:MAG: two pore domain potassium channel family protein [Betaproteobacteria bacterium]|nr:MAG: two pore domain potassium channel family protein [Betaproteobacteria bacterium]
MVVEQPSLSTTSLRRSRFLHRAELLRAWSMSVLLVVIIGGIFVVPVIVPRGNLGEIINDVALTLILLSGAVAIAEPKVLHFVTIALCIVAVVLRWLEWLVPSSLSMSLREGSGLLALILVLSIVATRVFASAGTVSADRIMGAVVLYLLLGIAWAAAYEVVALLHTANAFAGGDLHAKGPARWLYFSFVTLTTVGYGDITPVAPAARSLAVLEALLGQLYPAIILARLVSLHAK